MSTTNEDDIEAGSILMLLPGHLDPQTRELAQQILLMGYHNTTEDIGIACMYVLSACLAAIEDDAERDQTIKELSMAISNVVRDLRKKRAEVTQMEELGVSRDEANAKCGVDILREH